MAVNEALSAYSTTAASNTPLGTDAVGPDLDNHLRDIKKNMAILLRTNKGETNNVAGRLRVDDSASLTWKLQIRGPSSEIDLFDIDASSGVATPSAFSGSVAFGSNVSVAGGLTFAGKVVMSGDITPAQLTADQNDYTPTGITTASVMRLTADATRTIKGLAGGSDGRKITIHNIGSNTINLTDESPSSTTVNRFDLGVADTLSLSIREDRAIDLWYDATDSRWRAASRPEKEATATSLGVVEKATEAEMEAETADKFPDAEVLKHHPGVAKAWGLITVSAGTPTLAASYNVTSITDTATGRVTVTLATDFATANYVIVVGASQPLSPSTNANAPTVVSQVAGSFELFMTNDEDHIDPAAWHFACYGTQ